MDLQIRRDFNHSVFFACGVQGKLLADYEFLSEKDSAMMVALDVHPIEPLNSLAVVVSQSTAQSNAGITKRIGPLNDLVRFSDESGYTKVLTYCEDSDGFEHLDPLALVAAHLGYREDPKTRQWTPSFNWEKDTKLTVLQQPSHGIIGKGVLSAKPEAYGYLVTERDASGAATYQGTDKVVFAIEIKRQKFKVVLNLAVCPNIDDTKGKACELMKFGLSDMPSGDLAAWQRSVTLSSLIFRASP